MPDAAPRVVPLLLLVTFFGSSLIATAAAAVVPLPTCEITVEVVPRTALAWQDSEWKGFRQEAERPWRPYGVRLHWAEAVKPQNRSAAGSPGIDLYVILADEPLRSPDAGSHDPIGWLGFDSASGPGRLIVLAVNAARRLLGSVAFAGRPLREWPLQATAGVLARALGRALSHELGHYLLRTREHASDGLMRASFVPEDFLAGSPGRRLALTKRQELLMSRQCWPADRMLAQSTGAR